MAKWKVVISDYYYENINQELDILHAVDADVYDYHIKDPKELIPLVSDCDALICQFCPITKEVIDAMPKCKVIVRYAIGYDNIDIEAAAKAGIPVCNVPDYSIDEVSNQAIALLLDCAKKLTYMAGQVKKGNKGYGTLAPLYRMQGKTLGLVGFGRIPRLVSKKMAGFDLNIIAYDPFVDPKIAEEYGVKMVSFDELVETSDYISIHCALNESTHYLFNKDVFKKMKNTAILVNTARGGVVNEMDLVDALKTNEIYMAGIDVMETEDFNPSHPIFALDNAVVTSHVAWYSVDAVLALQRMVAEEVARSLKGEALRSVVNKPVNQRK